MQWMQGQSLVAWRARASPALCADRDELVLAREIERESDREAHDGVYSEWESARELSSSSMKSSRDPAESFDGLATESTSEPPQSSSCQGSEYALVEVSVSSLCDVK